MYKKCTGWSASFYTLEKSWIQFAYLEYFDYFFVNPAVSEANMVDTCKHFEIGSGSVRSF